jgi:hypothetical protein
LTVRLHSVGCTLDEFLIVLASQRLLKTYITVLIVAKLRLFFRVAVVSQKIMGETLVSYSGKFPECGELFVEERKGRRELAPRQGGQLQGEARS